MTPTPRISAERASSTVRTSNAGQVGTTGLVEPQDDAGRSLVLTSPSGRVRATPPAAGARYWRISVMDPTGQFRVGQTTGGASRDSAERRILSLDRQLAGHLPAGASATMGADLLDYFLDETRPKNLGRPRSPSRWSASYADQNRYLVDRYLRPHLGRVALAAWAPAHAYAALNGCPSNYLVAKVRRTLSAILNLGVADSFLRSDQRDLHRVTVPLRPDRRPARHPRARQPDAVMLLRPDEVPSTAQVARLAEACPPRITDPRYWAGAVNLLAYGGIRIGELFAMAFDDVLGDLPAGLVTVRYQVIEPRGQCKRLAPPKNGFARLLAVCDVTPTGFPLRPWLQERAALAATEQATGQNPAGALFATAQGRWWTRSNFRSRCFNPAATAAGWEQLTWHGPVSRRVAGRWTTIQTERHDWRHPIHALRHHYACTARDVWGWTGAELCLNGGWADEAFVLSRYYGPTADSYRLAVAKQASTAPVAS